MFAHFIPVAQSKDWEMSALFEEELEKGAAKPHKTSSGLLKQLRNIVDGIVK